MLNLLQQLSNAIQLDTDRTQIHRKLGISVHNGRDSFQRTLTEPTLIIIVKGEENVTIDTRIHRVRANDILVLPPTRLGLGPCASVGRRSFQWIAIHFNADAIRHFKKTHGDSLGIQKPPFRWRATAQKPIIALILQWLDWNSIYLSSSRHVHHRQSELLLILTEASLAFNILFDQQSSSRLRVHQLLSMNPKHRWFMKDVCLQLGVSKATLRRRLSAEKTTFRKILEQVRLEASLVLLRKTNLHISRISEDVGYESQSRFGERFKQYFGVTPSELRRKKVTQHMADKH